MSATLILTVLASILGTLLTILTPKIKEILVFYQGRDRYPLVSVQPQAVKNGLSLVRT